MKRFGRGKALPQGEMNKTEQAYAEYLFFRHKAGEVLWWKFEGIKFRLAKATFYTPDFILMTCDHQIEIHEVKGYWEDDARVKIKVASEMFPFRFLAVTKSKDGWKEEQFGE